MVQDKKSVFAFTIKYSAIVNRIITEVDIYPAFDPNNIPAPPPKGHHAKALWDTGATRSVITRATANTLGLIPVNSVLVNHAGGTSQCNTYIVNIMLPNKLGIPGVMVAECVDTVGDFGVIIGMDIINSGDLAISNVNRQTVMSFRIPSITVTDYVVETNRVKYAGVGRNAPCPCGKKDKSGKSIKFKHCCGKTIT